MTKNRYAEYKNLPGYEILNIGLKDLKNKKVSASSVLLKLASPRLNYLGVELAVSPKTLTNVNYQH